MDVVFRTRHIEVSDSFKSHVEDKVARLEKHDHRIIRLEVEVEKDDNPRLADRAVTVQLTAKSKGPVVRAECSAHDKMAALDGALDRMQGQMRKAADRKRVHRGRRTPTSVAEATADLPLEELQAELADAQAADAARAGDSETEHQVGPISVEGDGPMVVREKSHAAAPMTLEQALYEMELVGHDFFLYVDKRSERPAVVYRRRGYDYGVISLDVQPEA
ncbi:ribosome-associated translation inhibitor RaiA [Nocardioidaceae bacterium]|nr:ribosome-associated translation inhibitor RaiA [Nocardioidaceae bacterium]